MLKKAKFYFDTSVFSFYFAEDAPEKQEITRLLLDYWSAELGEIFISEVVLREINDAPEEKKNQLTALVNKIQPTLIELNEEIEELAEKYITNGIIPVKYRDDALHLAAAVVNDLNVVVSWNFEHLVKWKTKRLVNATNMLLGYANIEIISPQEVI